MRAALLATGGALALLGAVALAQTAGAPPRADAGAPPSDKVRVLIQTVPPAKAQVIWGRKPLGWIRGKGKPLIVERPRDSGPLDIVVKAEGHLPVHTRAHTFSDHKLFVKITPVEEKKSLFGYRQELPDAGADGGPAVVAGPPLPGPPLPAREGGAGDAR